MNLNALLNRWRSLGMMLAAGFVLGGCMTTSDLSKHPLDGKTVFVVSEIPDAPFADFNMTIIDRVGQEGPMTPPALGDVILQGKKDDAPHPRRRTHVLMDSVLADFDMSDQIILATTQRIESAMRFQAIDEEEVADYRLELLVDDYGIGADSYEGTAYFEVAGRLKLIDNATNRKVWEGEVMDISPLTRALISVGLPGDKMDTPAELANVSYESMREVLIALVGYAAVQFNAPFQEAYYRSLAREEARL